jgi:hypothetical protein
MKPPEILSLLEEAAGTRMYEKKKEQAIHTLEKKQAKLEQIDSVRAWGGTGGSGGTRGSSAAGVGSHVHPDRFCRIAGDVQSSASHAANLMHTTDALQRTAQSCHSICYDITRF